MFRFYNNYYYYFIVVVIYDICFIIHQKREIIGKIFVVV